MSIFDGKKKQNEEEQVPATMTDELAAKLAKATILEDIDRFVAEKAAQDEWMTQCQSYYESGYRLVKIHEDLLSIAWKETKVETTANGAKVTIIDVDNEEIFHYTDHGYMPLHNFENELGNEKVTLDTILYLWGVIVRERMMKVLPQCEFGPVYQSIGETTFTYKVPAKNWKDWF